MSQLKSVWNIEFKVTINSRSETIVRKEEVLVIDTMAENAIDEARKIVKKRMNGATGKVELMEVEYLGTEDKD